MAVAFEDKRLTYAELNRHANRLARYLRKLGVGPEVLVGIYVERSLEMIVGLLGVLKAGGGYVPLDPAYPENRLSFMIKDAGLAVILTQEHLRARLSEQGGQVICLDADAQGLEGESEENFVGQVTPENLAYVIYTSGSTGQPKGVVIQHKSLANLTEHAADLFALKPSDRVLQFASLSFDTAAEEIFPSLARGATLVLRTDSMLDSVQEFLRRCRDWELTVIDLPTAYWHEMVYIVAEEDLELPPQLRLVIIGGERALPERLDAWHKHANQQVQLLNGYGPTEATVTATFCSLARPEGSGLQEVPIGRAIRNAQAYVLDPHLQPVPIGVAGELYIGGAGLARGYLNCPALIAERFIPSPFATGARIYRTGDLARYLLDGNLEFVGRFDDQVKIRGFRVEPREVESVLGRHPEIKEAVVMATEDLPGEMRLVAYVVSSPEQSPVPDGLQVWLRQELPEYMLPSSFVFLDSLGCITFAIRSVNPAIKAMLT